MQSYIIRWFLPKPKPVKDTKRRHILAKCMFVTVFSKETGEPINNGFSPLINDSTAKIHHIFMVGAKSKQNIR